MSPSFPLLQVLGNPIVEVFLGLYMLCPLCNVLIEAAVTMSHQPPYEIKLAYMKARQAHEVAMYRAKTARRLVYLWAFIALMGIISAMLINFRSDRVIDGTPLVRPVPKPPLAFPYLSTRPQK